MSVPVRGQLLGRLKAHAVELGRSSLAKEGRGGELLSRGFDWAVAEGAGKGRDGQAGGGGRVVEGGASIEPVLLGRNPFSQQNLVSRVRAVLHLQRRVGLEGQIGTRDAAGSLTGNGQLLFMRYVPKIERDKVSEDSCTTWLSFREMKVREKERKRKGRRLLNEGKKEWRERQGKEEAPSISDPSFAVVLSMPFNSSLCRHHKYI